MCHGGSLGLPQYHDIVAAQGKIIPSEYSKVVQPLESGVVTAIHVQNGTGEQRCRADRFRSDGT